MLNRNIQQHFGNTTDQIHTFQVMLTFVTFLLLCYSAGLCNPHGVFWTIVDKYVMIGHDLNLYCNESSLAAINCCTKHSTRRWFGGPNRELLYRNGISSYPSKYTTRLEDGGFYLTIHNLEVNDLNVPYACSVSIYEYSNILRPRNNIVVPETSMSTKLSMSTEPSISGNTTIGWNHNILYMIIILVLVMGLLLVGDIAYHYRRRIKKLLIETLKLIEDQTEMENSDQKSSEEGKLLEDQTKTDNSDQNSLEKVHSNDASTTLQNGTEDANMESAQNYSGGGVKKKSKSHVDQDQYTVNSGIAVIINNIEFDPSLDLPDRKGSDVDASSLYQRFQELGFDSVLLNDASDEDITEKFNEIKEDKKALKDTDCLFVVILTYGNEDHVFATDRSIKIKTLMDNFSAENCPELILKPKVFIFQACKGGELGRGVNVRVVRDKNQADAGGEFMEYDGIHGEMIRIPNEADFLVIYVTSSGYGAFRNTEKGSPFVRRLSKELHNMRKGENFYNVFTRVNRKVGTGYKPNYPQRKEISQMPCFISHLTKNLVLKS